jgi:hypothetical protein
MRHQKRSCSCYLPHVGSFLLDAARCLLSVLPWDESDLLSRDLNSACATNSVIAVVLNATDLSSRLARWSLHRSPAEFARCLSTATKGLTRTRPVPPVSTEQAAHNCLALGSAPATTCGGSVGGRAPSVPALKTLPPVQNLHPFRHAFSRGDAMGDARNLDDT